MASRSVGRLALAAAAAVILILSQSPARSAAGANAEDAARWTAPTFQRAFGGPGHAEVYPWGAAVAPDGTILIGDYWNYVVRRYSPDGKLLQTLSGKGQADGRNSAPHGVAADPVDGAVYIADMNHPTHRIIKLAPDGSFLANVNTFVPGVTIPYAYVTHIATGPDRRLYAVSSHNVPYLFTQILVFSPDGVFERALTGTGSEPGQLGLIHGIAVDGANNLYLGDATKGVIQKFDSAGAYVASIGARGTGPGRFKGDMRGLVIDRARGWIYAADAQASQIEKFALDGRHLATFGSEGTGAGQFRDGGRELAVAADGTLYAPDFGNHRVNVYDPSGASRFAFPKAGAAPALGGFNQPQGVAVTESGAAAYVADTYNHRVQQFDSTGKAVRAWGFRGSTAPTALNYPRGVAVDPGTGHVWVANSRQGNVKRFTAGGRFLAQFGSWGTGTGQYQLARDLVVRGNRVYHADSNNNRLVATTRTGATVWSVPCGTNFIPGQGPGLQEGCTGIDVDAAGNVYAAAVSENALYKFSPAGALLGKVTTGLSTPYGVAVAGTTVYVSESGAHRVSAYSTALTRLGAFGSRGRGPGQFIVPRGIDADAAGTVYVVDSLNERVVVFR